MQRLEFRLSMPNRGSWNGGWTGEGRNYVLYRNVTDKQAEKIGIKDGHGSWYYGWSDGWGASITACVMEPGEKRKKSDGFSGYDWMVDNICVWGFPNDADKDGNPVRPS